MVGFEGKKVLITGGTSGIGYATAKLFLERGAQVALTGRDPGRLQAAASSLPGKVLALQADVRSLPDLKRMQTEVRTAFGNLDVLFANAGVAFGTPLERTDEALFHSVIDSNVKGVFFTVQAMVPLMERGSSVVLNTSWLAEVGIAPLSLLSASKAAVRSFARTFAAELLPRGIRVNAVSPGAIDTPIHGTDRMTEAERETFIDRMERSIPLGRLGTPEQIAQAVLFLAGEQSSYMLGAEIAVDGGYAQL